MDKDGNAPSINRRKTILYTLLTIIVVLLLINYIGLHNFVQIISELSFTTLAIVLIIVYFDFIVRASRWFLILKMNPKNRTLRFITTLKGIILGHTFNSYLPGRIGEISRIATVKRDNISYSLSTSSIICEHVFDFASISILGILSLFLISSGSSVIPTNNIAIFFLLVSFILLFIFVAVVILTIKKPYVFTILVSKISKPISLKVDRIADSFRSSFMLTFDRSNKTQIPVIVLQSLSIWIIESLIVFILIFNYSLYASYELVLFATLVGAISFIFPLLPGNYGSLEVLVGTILSLGGGIPIELAISLVFLGHILFTVFSSLLGIPIIAFEVIPRI